MARMTSQPEADDPDLCLDVPVVDDDEIAVDSDDLDDDEIEWITTKEAAGVLGLSTPTLTRNRDAWGLTWRGSNAQLEFARDEIEAVAARLKRMESNRRILRGREEGVPVWDDEDMLNTGDVALVLGVTRETVTARIARGKIPVVRKDGLWQWSWIRWSAVKEILKQEEEKRRER